jgi:3-hydroxyacyl-CoA dehydrogenase/enoyl-CoA hydratase/3-hydroxybutyryl-CoA epimerase/enoyl-CoA isomerase
MKFQGKTLTLDFVEAGIAEISFDRQEGSVNKFDALTLTELRQAVDGLSRDKVVKGLMLTSSKSVFVVGADITEFGQWFAKSRQQLVDDLLSIHETFSAIEDLPFPTVAVINGFALGGGFEVCLACDYRVMSTRARVGLPEVKLGLFPGWGGTIRLSRLLGADNALEWIGLGKDRRPEQALSEGAVDAVVKPEELKKSALSLLEACIEGKLDYKSRREDKKSPLRLTEIERTMVFETAKSLINAKVGPHYPAPMTALRCMEKHARLDRDSAAKVEAEAFAELAKNEVAHNLVGLFLNDQSLARIAKAYAKEARPVKQVAVLGAGIMGGGIAYQTALKGIPIVMKDIAAQALELGLSEARNLLIKGIDRGRMTPGQMSEVLTRINPTLKYGDVEGADIVVEAVVENEDIKKGVLRELENTLSETAIIASNTSTISISNLAGSLENQERFCGMHFFNPVHVMPLVEIIRGEHSSKQAIATTVTFAKAIGKNPIVVNDCPGFLVNRVLFPYLNAFTALIRDGADFQKVDKIMEGFGWPMGPAYLLDVIGMDTACHAGNVLAAGYPDRMQNTYTSAIQALYDADRLGQKSGSGFYRYEKDKRGKPKKKRDETVYELIHSAGDGHAFSDQEIVDRMMVPMCLETARCLEEGIVESAMAADMGLIWGIGFPPFRGGALRYIDTIGIERFCESADRYAALGKAYQPTEQFRAAAANGKRFFEESG